MEEVFYQSLASTANIYSIGKFKGSKKGDTRFLIVSTKEINVLKYKNGKLQLKNIDST